MSRSIFGTTESQQSIDDVTVYTNTQLDTKLDNNGGIMNGELNMNGNNLSSVNQVNGVNVTDKFAEVSANTLANTNQQTAINTKLSLSGGTMTGTLNLTDIASSALETMLSLTPDQLTIQHQEYIEMKILSDLVDSNKIRFTAFTTFIRNNNVSIQALNSFDFAIGSVSTISANSNALLLQGENAITLQTTNGGGGLTVTDTNIVVFKDLHLQSNNIVNAGLYNGVNINTHVANSDIHVPVDDGNLGNSNTLWSSFKTESEITAVTNSKGFANGICPLDGAGKIPNIYIPPLALTKPTVYTTEAQMLASESLTEEGDVAIVTGLQKSFMYKGVYDPDPLLTTGQFIELATTGAINTVNGISGSAVLLTTDDVPEGATSLYYETGRVFADTTSIVNGQRQFTGLTTFQQGVSIVTNGLNMNATDITMNNGFIVGLRTLTNGNANDATNRGFVTTITDAHNNRITAVEAKTATLSIQTTGAPTVKGTIINDADNIFLRLLGVDRLSINGVLTTNANTTITDTCTIRNINSTSQTNIVGPTTLITATTSLTATSPTINLNSKFIQNATTSTITNTNLIINASGTLNVQYGTANKITVGTARTILNNSELEMSNAGTLFHYFSPGFTNMNSTQISITGGTDITLSAPTINLNGASVLLNGRGIEPRYASLTNSVSTLYSAVVSAFRPFPYDVNQVTYLMDSTSNTVSTGALSGVATSKRITVLKAGDYRISASATIAINSSLASGYLIKIIRRIQTSGNIDRPFPYTQQFNEMTRGFQPDGSLLTFQYNWTDILPLNVGDRVDVGCIQYWFPTYNFTVDMCSLSVELLRASA